MKTLSIRWDGGGLREAIVFNGLIRSMAPWFNQVFVACSRTVSPSLHFMFRDLGYVYPVSSREENFLLGNKGTLMSFACSQPGWDKNAYETCCVPFKKRWSEFRVKRDVENEIVIPRKPYIFVFQDLCRNMKIDSKLLPKGIHIAEPWETSNIFQWCRAIEEASEIHVIDGEFLALVDSLNISAGVRKVFHPYARKSFPPTLSDSFWEIASSDKQFKMARSKATASKSSSVKRAKVNKRALDE